VTDRECRLIWTNDERTDNSQPERRTAVAEEEEEKERRKEGSSYICGDFGGFRSDERGRRHVLLMPACTAGERSN